MLSNGNIQRNNPTGRTVEGTVRIEAKGAGVDYSQAGHRNDVPNIYTFMPASGFNYDNGGAAGSGSWVFSPTFPAFAPNSLSVRAIQYGEQWDFKGGLCDFSVGSDGAAPAIFEFKFKGLAYLPVEMLTAPTVALTGSFVQPPKMTDSTISIGSFMGAKLRKWNFSLNRDITPNLNVNNSDTHGGFTPGRRAPKFTVTIEATKLSDFNPHAKFSAGAVDGITITVGTQQFNKYRIDMSYCQLISPPKSTVDGNTVTWELEYACATSGPTANDDVQITFN
jgi:hypothetical protein